jgi:hypothetical protein
MEGLIVSWGRDLKALFQPLICIGVLECWSIGVMILTAFLEMIFQNAITPPLQCSEERHKQQLFGNLFQASLI